MTVELIHKELSFKLVGLAFEVFNILGPGHPEKIYKKAYEELMGREKINFRGSGLRYSRV